MIFTSTSLVHPRILGWRIRITWEPGTVREILIKQELLELMTGFDEYENLRNFPEIDHFRILKMNSQVEPKPGKIEIGIRIKYTSIYYLLDLETSALCLLYLARHINFIW